MKIDITELNVIDLKPGQVLVATVSGHLSPDQIALIHEDLSKVFPNNKVAVKTDELKFEVINAKA